MIITQKYNKTMRSIWHGMIRRCYDTKFIRYKDYGGRGIEVCKPWLDSFDVFCNDIGNRPGLNYSIDRIDKDGNYSPDNTRWATEHEQQSNRRNNNKNVGVSFDKTKNKWLASLMVNRKYVLHRNFKLEQEAIKEREKYYNIFIK